MNSMNFVNKKTVFPFLVSFINFVFIQLLSCKLFFISMHPISKTVQHLLSDSRVFFGGAKGKGDNYKLTSTCKFCKNINWNKHFF